MAGDDSDNVALSYALIPPENETYSYLRGERETAKANYAANLITLDNFLGKLGVLSRKSGKQKVNSDADPAEEGDTCAKGKEQKEELKIMIVSMAQPKKQLS